MAIYLQVICTISLAYLCTLMGMINGWPSSTVLLFRSSNTTLDRPMRETEISLLGSLPAIGCMIMNPIAGFMLDIIGRKSSTLVASIILVISWSIIALTNQVELILLAMLISGIGSSVFLIASVFVSEICEDSIRGTMTAMPIQFYCLGFLISYLLGGYLEYNAMVYTFLSMTIVGVVIVSMMKESPISLMMKGEEENAAKSIAFYRRKNETSTEVLKELDRIRRLMNSTKEDTHALMNTKDSMEPSLPTTKDMTRWQYFKNSPSTQRQLFVVMALKIAYIYQGLPLVQVYAEPLFAKAVPSDVMSANMCSILSGVVMLLSGMLGAYVTDLVGRLPLLTYSSIVAGTCCVVLGTQLSLEWAPTWIVPVFIYIYIAFYMLGAGTVTFVVLGEVFVPKVKSIMTMIAVEWSWVVDFTLLFFFPPLVSAVGLSPVFFIFAAVCFGTSVFCYFYLPETKGLPLDAVQDIFMEKKRARS